jgi:hypothetical protein
VSDDIAWECDDFVVIGSGAIIGETSLYHRERSFLSHGLEKSLYHVCPLSQCVG